MEKEMMWKMYRKKQMEWTATAVSTQLQTNNTDDDDDEHKTNDGKSTSQQNVRIDPRNQNPNIEPITYTIICVQFEWQ